ncbi:histidine kinase [Streptomyces sp. NBC_01622]|uniref:sensor histidine kinase n=1 Tax=Streptomyces sp. NBC_01622 TaxID=2975903 RepID=UPI00386FBEC2|nr:histidine kinase [Streptomyces sp. NBC_01622]
MRFRWWLRPRVVVWPLVAALLLTLGLFDHRWGMFDDTTIGLLKLGSALLAVAALLASPRLGPRALPVSAGVAAVASLGTTVALHVVSARSVGENGIYPTEPYGLTEPAALLGLLTLVVWRGRPVPAAATALALIPAIVLRPLAEGVKETTAVMAFFFTLAATAALGIGLTVRLVTDDRRRRETTVRLEQRAEFARDLHDFVAHHVTGIVVQAQGARAIAVGRPQLVPPALERIEQAGVRALTSMRAMVGMLRDADRQGDQGDRGDQGDMEGPALAPLAGIDEVRSLVEEFAPVGGGRALLRIEGAFDDLPVEVITTVHRVVMEALTNVRKHSRDFTEVEVCLLRSAGRVLVKVTDDGRPRPALGHALGGGFGLKGLAERVEMIGGRVEAGPGTAGGWSIGATMPVGKAA